MATYCERCGGTLIFDQTIKKMSCCLCLNTFDIDEIKVTDNDNSSSGADTFPAKIFTCKTCGKDMIVSASVKENRCFVCGSKGIEFKKTAKIARPEYVIPFTVKKSHALRSIQDSLKLHRFVPAAITHLDPDDMTSVYIPFKIVSGEHKNAVYTQTGRMLYAGMTGSFRFTDMLLPASTALDKKPCSKLESFDKVHKAAFNENDLDASYIDIPDLSYDGSQEANDIADKIFCNATEKKGFTILRSRPATTITAEDSYALMPAWVLTTTHNGDPVNILVNGNTKVVSGQLPMDTAKSRFYLIIGLLGVLIFFVCGIIGVLDLKGVEEVDSMDAALTGMVGIGFAVTLKLAMLASPLILVILGNKNFSIPVGTKHIELGIKDPDTSSIAIEDLQIGTDIEYSTDRDIDGFFAILDRKGKATNDTIPDELPTVNKPLFKPAGDRR